MKPIIIDGHEAVEWFHSKAYANRRKEFHERHGFDVLLHYAERWNGWFVCIRTGD